MPDRPESVDNLIVLINDVLDDFEENHNAQGLVADGSLDAAIALEQYAEDDLNLINLLGWFYWSRAKELGADGQADQRRALRMFTSLTDTIPEDLSLVEFPKPKPTSDPYRKARKLLADAIRNHDDAGLGEAIVILEQVIDGAASDDPDLGLYLCNIATAWHIRYEVSGDEQFLAKALQFAERAVSVADASSRWRGMILAALTNIRRDIAQRSTRVEDVDQAVAAAEEALAATAMDDPSRASILTNSALAYRTKFDQTGALSTVDRAIELNRIALAVTCLGDGGGRIRLVNLSLALYARYKVTGAVADLDESILLLTEVAHVLSNDAIMADGVAVELGSAWHDKYRITQEREHLDNAIVVLEVAAAVAPEGETSHRKALTELVLALNTRLGLVSNADDLDRIVLHLRRLDDIVRDDDTQAAVKSALVKILRVRQARTESASDFADFANAAEHLGNVMLESAIRGRAGRFKHT